MAQPGAYGGQASAYSGQAGAYGGQAGAYGGQAGAYGGQPAQMSQQATTSMLLSSAKVNPRLRQLMDNDKNNQECADCSTQNPTWASYNIGVFLCEKCCGVHRRIGTHISKPRSIDLDEWTPAHLEAMEVVGNTNADAYWCYNVPIGRSKPEDGDAMVIITDWIQSKYEQKQFCKRPGAASERTDPGVAAYEKSGFIEKMGGAKDGGKWQRRWFELKNFQLSYYKSPPEPGKKVVPKGIIPITPQVVIKCSTGMGVDGEQVQDRMIEGNGFIVRDPSQGRDFNLRTEAGDDLVDWVIKLRGVKAYANTQHARQATDVAFASYLLKQGGKGVTKWQQRWVVLKANGDIVYYKDNKSTHPKGDMRLQGPCVRMTPIRQYCFEFTDSKRTKGPVIMAAESERDYQQWRQALRQWIIA